MFHGRSSSLVAAGVLLTTAVLGGCGDETSGPGLSPGVPYGSPAPSGQQNDPAVSAAAQRLDPILRRDFTRTYSGMVLNHQARILVIYRKPDAALDARVHNQVREVTVDLREARFSLREMQDLTARVLGDSPYWSKRGITINGAGPKADGSGIDVMTSTGSPGDSEKLAERYNVDTGAITVTKTEVIPPIGQPWTPPTIPPLPSVSSS